MLLGENGDLQHLLNDSIGDHVGIKYPNDTDWSCNIPHLPSLGWVSSMNRTTSAGKIALSWSHSDFSPDLQPEWSCRICST